jgi:hypothetical protein
MANGIVNPWDDQAKHDVAPGSVAAFKYRHRTRDGHYEDSLPALNSETKVVRTIRTQVTIVADFVWGSSPLRYPAQ